MPPAKAGGKNNHRGDHSSKARGIALAPPASSVFPTLPSEQGDGGKERLRPFPTAAVPCPFCGIQRERRGKGENGGEDQQDAMNRRKGPARTGRLRVPSTLRSVSFFQRMEGERERADSAESAKGRPPRGIQEEPNRGARFRGTGGGEKRRALSCCWRRAQGGRSG